MKADFPRAGIFTPMPGTRLTKIAIDEGYLSADFSYDDVPNTILDKTILLNVNAEKINNYLYFFQTAIILPGCRNLILRLVKIKPNIIYKLWFYIVYLYLHRKSEGRNIFSYIKYVFANRKYK
jgi:hypothetical protein